MYTALRSMQVQGADGSMRQVQPGEAIPEAAKWKNRKAYENRGWIARDSGAVSEHNVANAVAVAVADRDETIGRLNAELEDLQALNSGTEPAPEATEDEESAEPSNESPPEATEDEETLKLSESELKAMSKGSLQAIADDLGLNPDQSKAKLVEAVLAAQ